MLLVSLLGSSFIAAARPAPEAGPYFSAVSAAAFRPDDPAVAELVSHGTAGEGRAVSAACGAGAESSCAPCPSSDASGAEDVAEAVEYSVSAGGRVGADSLPAGGRLPSEVFGKSAGQGGVKRPDALSAGPESAFSVRINGTVRAKFEYQPDIDKGRFEVRNARFGLSGSVTPVVDYKAEIDLSDEGSIRMLDAYVRLDMLRSRLRFTIGQMRVPFTIDAHRSPHEQYFANRSFIAKQAGNVRDVGATLGWSFGGEIPVVIEGGLFNGSGLTEQKDFWTGRFNYSIKGQAWFAERVNLTLGFQKVRPEAVDVCMYDAGVFYDDGRWHVEAEYLRKNYAGGAFPGVNAVDAFVCRDFPVKRILNRISVLLRYDYLSDHSDGTFGSDGVLHADDPARHRITGGLTFGLGLPFRADIRLNYEAYFYRASAVPAVSEQDKLVVEFMVRF